jgi:hypothetical protein
VKLALAAILLFAPLSAFADGPLPLNGYYRLGRYMPVRFAAGTAELHLTADGAVETVVADPAGGIAPCFLSRTPPPDAPMANSLRALRPNEKLIGLAADAGSAAQLFPGATIVTVPLDPVHPLPGPPAAWQSLDAVILSAAAAAELSDTRINVLLSGGTTLAVPAVEKQPPETTWPWRLENGFWILHAAQPLDAEASDEDFAPASGWTPGRSAHDRAQVMLMGVSWAIVVLLIAVIPQRWRWAKALDISMAAFLSIMAFGLWDIMQSPTSEAVGFVDIISEPPIKEMWIFKLSSRLCTDSTPCDRFALPILARQGGPEDMKLICNRTGNPIEFRYDLPPDHPAAFIYRSIAGETPPGPIVNPITSPMRFLPSSLYPGFVPVGQVIVPTSPDMPQWPILVLARSHAMPRNFSPSHGRDSSNR